jgi:HK97 family phage major capsid protein
MEQEQRDQSYLAQLIKTRNELAKEAEVIESKRDAIVAVARAAGRETLNDDEDRDFREHITKIKGLDAEISAKDGLIGELDEANQRKSELRAGAAKAAAAQTGLESVNEQATYVKGGHNRFFLDVMDATLGDTAAQERLRRHELQDVRSLPEYQEYRTTLNTTTGTGGSFTPPAYLLAEWIKFARPGRPFADIVANEALMHGTMQVNVPKIQTGTAVGWQTSQNTAVGETDLTDEYVTANVVTIAGNQTLSRQLLDQSGIPMDTVVFGDLTAAHAQFLDAALYTGSGSGGQLLGVNNVSGIQTVVTGGLTIQFVYAAVANAIQAVWTSRFASPDAILMHPRRWGWFLSLLDANDRPLFLPESNAPYNVAGLSDRVAPEAVVGRMHNLPVITDPSIPTTLGAGSNQDAIYVVKSKDLVLFESGIRAEAFREPLAAQMSVLLQVSSYDAFLSRYPSSIVEITGFTPPTWGS